jgi:hypothetical protein
MLATYLNRPEGASVTLRRPPPLGVPLDVRIDAGSITVFDGAALIAEACAAPPGALDEVVPAVPWAEAMAVSAGYLGFVSHPFPTCFVCGPQRPEGDGLRLFPGRLADGRTAAPWVVPDDVEPRLMWAALDCPGGWSVAAEDRPYVLGRLTARVDGLPAAGDGCVVTGAAVAAEGRRAEVLSTVYGVDGTVLARARAVWVAVAR